MHLDVHWLTHSNPKKKETLQFANSEQSEFNKLCVSENRPMVSSQFSSVFPILKHLIFRHPTDNLSRVANKRCHFCREIQPVSWPGLLRVNTLKGDIKILILAGNVGASPQNSPKLGGVAVGYACDRIWVL